MQIRNETTVNEYKSTLVFLVKLDLTNQASLGLIRALEALII